MKHRHLFTLSIACVFASAAAPAIAQAGKVAAGGTRSGTQAAAPGVATFGLPNAAGLPSPAPAGLTPPGPPQLTPPGSPNISSPGSAPGSPVVDPGVQLPLAAGGGVMTYPQATAGGTNSMGAGGTTSPRSSLDIARLFMQADLNRDGELSRAEAQTIALPAPFDDLDRNRDGVLSRFEFDDAFK